MKRNYAAECGSFRAMSLLFCRAAEELGAATTDIERNRTLRSMARLVQQHHDLMRQFGYAEPMPEPRVNLDE